MTEQPDYPKTAWGDESVRVHANPPMYLLGATILPNDCNELLSKLHGIKPKGAAKLHWRDLGASAQKKSLDAIADAVPATTIVTASPLIGSKQERARRKCLERMLIELERKNLNKLVLETRDYVEDKRDVDFLYYLQRSKIVSHISLTHVKSIEEPRIDIPDQILGAFGDVLVQNKCKPSWENSWETIGQNLKIIDVKL